MATNNFKAFGIGAAANVTSQSDYEALAALLTGFQSGKASSAQINKALRQSTTMANVLAQFIADSASVDVLDNGAPATILANLKLAMTALTPGRLINIQVFNSSGTYTPTAGVKKIMVEVIGGGGGGGGIAAGSSSSVAVSGGGGSGAYIKAFLTNLPSSIPITIGQAGVAGTSGGGNGGNGGTTYLGDIISASGGNGGGYGSTGTNGVVQGGSGGQTVTKNTATVSMSVISEYAGSKGGYGVLTSTSAGSSGNGGDSPLGNGGSGFQSGNDGTGAGSGGGGAINLSTGTTTRPGGKGAPGAVIIWEYA